MRIIQVTPGTGNFHCGACIRDYALASAWHRKGHDVLVVPLYLPMVLDEPAEVRQAPVFFGGLNVFLQQKFDIFRKTPRRLDELLDTPWILRWLSRYSGMTTAKGLGQMTLSMLNGESGRQAKELNRLVAWLQRQEPPDVLMLSNGLLVGSVRRIKETLKVPVVVSLQGEDSFLDSLKAPYRERAWELLAERAKDVDAFIPVSRYFGNLMKNRLQLPEDKVHVVWNGISLAGHKPETLPFDPPVIGYLARMCPAKGLHDLVEAFIVLKKRNIFRTGLRMRVAGAMTLSDTGYVENLKDRLFHAGVRNDVVFMPNVERSEKLDFLREVSVLSVPVTYDEAFGLYVIEALASGVPVVEPRRGALPELLEATGGGILYEPGSAESLADGLESILLDPERARFLGCRGRKAVHESFSQDRMAEEVASVIESLLGERQNR